MWASALLAAFIESGACLCSVASRDRLSQTADGPMTRIASRRANSSRRPEAAPASLTFVATLCFFVARFAQLSPLRAQAAVTNRVLELDGKDGYVELPPRMFEGLHEATVEGWVKWRAFGHYFRFLDYGRANDTL